MVSSEEEIEAKTGDTVEWDVDMEIQLFYAMANHKPVGVDKRFAMVCIYEKLSNSITKELSTQDIWKHLEKLYDLPMLDDSEAIPFPNTEVQFSLPQSEFGPLIKHKCKEAIVGGDESDDGGSSSPKPHTPRSSSRGRASKDSTPKAGARKDSTGASLATKTRKESGSSHASTDTPSVKSEKDYDRRRDSRDSNASGPKDSSSRKSSKKDKTLKPRTSGWDSPLIDEEGRRRARRRANTSTPPATVPAKRRRT